MMERLLYCILKSVAILPLQVLYVLADCVFFLLYYIIRYRRRVVADNLAQSSTVVSPRIRRSFIQVPTPQASLRVVIPSPADKS